MAEHQQVDSKELAELLGVKKLPSDALKQLKSANLIDVGKVGRVNAYALSANGWDRCVEIMGLPIGARGTAPRALLALLQALHRGFSVRPELTPREFFSSSDNIGQPISGNDIEDLIRKAYSQLARMPGDWVPLAGLRDVLAQFDRRDVDIALGSLALKPGIQLIPWDNRKALSKRDLEAALRFGGEDNHALRIEAA